MRDVTAVRGSKTVPLSFQKCLFLLEAFATIQKRQLFEHKHCQKEVTVPHKCVVSYIFTRRNAMRSSIGAHGNSVLKGPRARRITQARGRDVARYRHLHVFGIITAPNTSGYLE